MTPSSPLPDDELNLLNLCVPLQRLDIIELGCGNARLARRLVREHRGCTVAALEVDAVQHAKNLTQPEPGLTFVPAGAQAIPYADASFDLALMLKSLHHVPLADMDRALDEIARVVRPGGHLYVSEPVYAGPLNDIVKLFNDEGVVRAEAQRALDRARVGPHWVQVQEHRFETPVHFESFTEFEQRMMHPTFADHRIDEAMRNTVAAAFAPHTSPHGANFTRPMHVRLLQRRSAGG